VKQQAFIISKDSWDDMMYLRRAALITGYKLYSEDVWEADRDFSEIESQVRSEDGVFLNSLRILGTTQEQATETLHRLIIDMRVNVYWGSLDDGLEEITLSALKLIQIFKLLDVTLILPAA
jgi:hypothetical protein